MMLQEKNEPSRENYQHILAQAKDALVEAKYNESERLYKEALTQARALFVEPCSDHAICLLGLGDSYYAANKFEDAKDTYLELLSDYESMCQVEAKDRVSALFRLAKTLAVLGEYAAADETFAETVAHAEPAWPLGHPMLTSIYESYANMLAKGNVDQGPERELFFREQARVCRMKFTPPKKPPKRETLDLSSIRKADEPKPTIFDETLFADKATEVVQSPVNWLEQNMKLVVVLLLVSLLTFLFIDNSVRVQLYRKAVHLFQHH